MQLYLLQYICNQLLLIYKKEIAPGTIHQISPRRYKRITEVDRSRPAALIITQAVESIKRYKTMKQKSKERAYSDFIEVIMHSWTWEKMTAQERDTFIDRVLEYSKVTGSYNSRYNQYQNLYSAYLFGLGYSGGEWREDEMQTLYAR